MATSVPSDGQGVRHEADGPHGQALVDRVHVVGGAGQKRAGGAGVEEALTLSGDVPEDVPPQARQAAQPHDGEAVLGDGPGGESEAHGGHVEGGHGAEPGHAAHRDVLVDGLAQQQGLPQAEQDADGGQDEHHPQPGAVGPDVGPKLLHQRPVRGLPFRGAHAGAPVAAGGASPVSSMAAAACWSRQARA
jgi:hypothetical protein